MNSSIQKFIEKFIRVIIHSQIHFQIYSFTNLFTNSFLNSWIPSRIPSYILLFRTSFYQYAENDSDTTIGNTVSMVKRRRQTQNDAIASASNKNNGKHRRKWLKKLIILDVRLRRLEKREWIVSRSIGRLVGWSNGRSVSQSVILSPCPIVFASVCPSIAVSPFIIFPVLSPSHHSDTWL